MKKKSKMKLTMGLLLVLLITTIVPATAFAGVVSHWYSSGDINYGNVDSHQINHYVSNGTLHATKIRVHFSYIGAEYNYDYLYLFSSRWGSAVQVFNGTYSDVWSDWIDGNTINIQLFTDSSISSTYTIDKYEVMTNFDEQPSWTTDYLDAPTRLPINTYKDNDSSGMVSDFTGYGASRTGQYPYAYNSHSGIDYHDEGASYDGGRPAYSVRNGIVKGTINDSGNMGCGTRVVIEHEEYTTIYCHLQYNSFDVVYDDWYPAGTQVGNIGCTGNCGGDHLHLSTLDSSGAFVDPYSLGLLKPLYPNSRDFYGYTPIPR